MTIKIGSKLDKYANSDIIDGVKNRKIKGLGDQLRQAFRASRLSMFTLSKKSGVPYSGIHRFIKADRDLTLNTATKLADVLGLELRRIIRK